MRFRSQILWITSSLQQQRSASGLSAALSRYFSESLTQIPMDYEGDGIVFHFPDCPSSLKARILQCCRASCLRIRSGIPPPLSAEAFPASACIHGGRTDRGGGET